MKRKTPVFVQNVETAVELSRVFIGKKSVYNGLRFTVLTLYRLCPIFQLSNVTGEGLDNVSTNIASRMVTHANRFGHS